MKINDGITIYGNAGSENGRGLRLRWDGLKYWRNWGWDDMGIDGYRNKKVNIIWFFQLGPFVLEVWK